MQRPFLWVLCVYVSAPTTSSCSRGDSARQCQPVKKERMRRGEGTMRTVAHTRRRVALKRADQCGGGELCRDAAFPPSRGSGR